MYGRVCLLVHGLSMVSEYVIITLFQIFMANHYETMNRIEKNNQSLSLENQVDQFKFPSLILNQKLLNIKNI